jgi:hypothetical protein
MRPPISSADLLQAFDALRPSTDEDKSAIAEVLGLQWKPVALSRELILPKDDELLKPTKMNQDQIGVPIPRVPKPIPVTRLSSNDSDFTIRGPVKQTSVSPLWSKPSGEFEPTLSPLPSAESEVMPLFVPRWTRGIMSTALADRTTTGLIDIREVVSEISQGRLLRTLPRFSTPAMARRVEILADVGISMLPFAADQRSVIAAVRTVAGSDNVSILKFTGSPLQGAGTDDMIEWPDFYTFPSSKTHVLLLSDLGIGRPPMTGTPASVEEWRRFGWELRRRQIACTAFVPYPARRWPVELIRQFHLVEWDRATTAGTIKFSPRPRTT